MRRELRAKGLTKIGSREYLGLNLVDDAIDMGSRLKDALMQTELLLH